jgi:hypothetical protein
MTNLRKWRKWILGVALLIACVESVALWQWNTRPKYLRYVSQSLKDGTRYTFLYPARLSMIREDKARVSITSQPQVLTLRDRSLLWLGWPRDQIVHEGHANELNAFCYQHVYVTEARNSRRRSSGKAYDHDQARYYDCYTHKIADAWTNSACSLAHQRFRENDETFQREDKVLSDSFKILPPGAPIPS